MTKKDAKMTKIPAKHLAEAAIKAAKVNNYLVGLVAPDNKPLHVSIDTANDALQIIYSMENAGKLTEKVASIAIHFINETGGGQKAGFQY